MKSDKRKYKSVYYNQKFIQQTIDTTGMCKEVNYNLYKETNHEDRKIARNLNVSKRI